MSYLSSSSFALLFFRDRVGVAGLVLAGLVLAGLAGLAGLVLGGVAGLVLGGVASDLFGVEREPAPESLPRLPPAVEAAGFPFERPEAFWAAIYPLLCARPARYSLAICRETLTPSPPCPVGVLVIAASNGAVKSSINLFMNDILL